MARKLIYAFDFDGTIVTNKFPEIGIPILNTIELIKKVKSDGHYIILNTMREGDLLDKAVEYCKRLDIEFDVVNDNLPHMKEFYKNNPRKIFANHYIDDHNLFVYGVNDCSDDIKEMQDMVDYYKHEYFAERDRNERIEKQDKIIEGLLCFIENNVTQACPYEIDDEQLEINWRKCRDCGILHGQQWNCWLEYFKNYRKSDDNA